MKRGWKIFWVTISILVGLGIICGCAAIAMGATMADLDNDFNNLVVREETMIMEEKIISGMNDNTEVYEFENITELEILVGACEVFIRARDIENVQVDMSRMKYQSLGLELQVEEVDGRLIIQTIENGNVLDVISANKKNGGLLKIYVPIDMILEKTDMEFGACDVEVSGLNVEQMNLAVGAAECEMEGMNVNSLKAQVGAGDFDYSGTVSGNVSIDCGAGDVDLNLAGVEEEFNYTLSAGLGEIEIGEREYGGFAVDKTINNHASKEMKIDCGAGSVFVDFR